MTNAVEIRDLHKSFKDLEVLKGIDLDVAQGEAVVLLGSTGSGKSTLLRCINLGWSEQWRYQHVGPTGHVNGPVPDTHGT